MTADARLREALERIVNMDYRGNPSPEQDIARAALRVTEPGTLDRDGSPRVKHMPGWEDFEPSGDREEMAYALMVAGVCIWIDGTDGCTLDDELADSILETLDHRGLGLMAKATDHVGALDVGRLATAIQHAVYEAPSEKGDLLGPMDNARDIAAAYARLSATPDTETGEAS